MTQVPHFSFPFRFLPQAAVTEQDSIEEIADCVLAVLVCPLGYRVELPQFGLPDPTFSSPAVDIEDIRTAVSTWEPRATERFRQYLDRFGTATIDTYVQVRTGE